MLNRWLSVLTAVFLLPAAYASSARAQGDKVYVNEVLILTLRYGTSAQLSKRTEIIARRFEKLDRNVNLTIDTERSYAKLMAEDEVLLTVSPQEAAAQNQTAPQLAGTWLQNLKDALALPPIKLSTDAVRLPISGKAQVATQGSEIEESTVQVSDPNVVATFHKHGILFLRGLSLGTSDITFAGPTSSETLHVSVQPYAAVLPQTVDVEVTGDPASRAAVSGAIQAALRTRLPRQPNSQIAFDRPDVSSIPIEQSRSYTIPVRVEGDDCFPAQGNVTVDIKNVPLAHRDETQLWYCNDPEDVKEAGNLFAARLIEDQAVRLLYHHDNAAGWPLAVEVRILNNSDTTARVQVIEGDAKPDRNPVLAGYQAGDRFLRSWLHSCGQIVVIPAHSAVPLTVHKLYPSETMSGLTYLRLLEGGPSELLVRTDAVSLDTLPMVNSLAFASSCAWEYVPAQPLNDNEENVRLSDQIYPNPFKSIDVSYRVGGNFGFAQIGQKPLQNLTASDELDGNFGVLYTVKAEVVNPTALPADVEITYQSGAGYSGGLFVIDGTVLSANLLQPQDEVRIGKLHVEPGESKTMTFMTCPLSGSSYPATIAVRPISALDGAAGAELHVVKQ